MAWVTEKVETVKSKMSSTRSRMGNAAGRTKKKIGKAMKRAYHVPKNRIMATETGQAARKKYRKAKNAAIYTKEKFAEFKAEITLKQMKSELKFVLKKKWWVPLITFLHLWSVLWKCRLFFGTQFVLNFLNLLQWLLPILALVLLLSFYSSSSSW